MTGVPAVFRPNQRVSTSVWYGLIGVQVALLFAWWLWAAAPIVPRPSEVLHAFGRLWFQDGLAGELWASLTVNAQALALTTVMSLGLSYLMVLPAARPLVLAVSKLRFLGLVGLTLIFTLMTGGGHALKVLTLAFGMTVFFVTSMAEEVACIPQAEYDHVRTLRMGEWRSVWEVAVLGRADQAIEVLRQQAAIGWMMLTMVEGLVRSEGGVGNMLLNANRHFHLADVAALQLVILCVGLVQDQAIGAFKNAACPWAAMGVKR